MDLIKLIIFVIIGFLLAKLLAGKREREREQGIVKSLKFKFNDYIIHIHHWLLASLILIVLLIAGYYSDYIYGFLIGLIIQGLTYRDFYQIIYRKDKPY